MSPNLDLQKLIKIHSPKLAIDTESTGLDIRDGRDFAIGLSFSNDHVSGYIPIRHQNIVSIPNIDHDELNTLRNFFKQYEGKIIFHNAKFDLVSLSTLGINDIKHFYCTQIMCHLINENYPFAKDLNSCVKTYVDKEESKKEEILKKAVSIYGGWGNVPVEFMYEYAKHDAVITYKLENAIRSRFNAENLEVIWKHKQKFIQVIIAMERRGIKINTDLCKHMYQLGTSVLDDLSETLDGNLGSPIFLTELLINQLKLPVVKTSIKTGKPSFDKEAMEIYDQILERTDDPTASIIKSYRGWQKSVTSNYKPYIDLLSPDGRLRPNYRLIGTVTGRLSCEKPNLQQIPRVSDKPWNGKMKAAFIPEEDYELWEFDFSQLELRLGTGYAGEKDLLTVFEEDRDIFTEMAEKIGLSRQDTKTLVYSIQYGAGINRIYHALGISKQRAAQIREEYYRAYPRFKAISAQASRVCIEKGKIKLWSGRYRHFKSRTDDSHKAFNSVIQGGAADIVERIMVKLFETVDNEDECRMLLQVHDSVVFEIRKDKITEYVPKIKKIMEDINGILDGDSFGVKFVVDAKEWGK